MLKTMEPLVKNFLSLQKPAVTAKKNVLLGLEVVELGRTILRSRNVIYTQLIAVADNLEKDRAISTTLPVTTVQSVGLQKLELHAPVPLKKELRGLELYKTQGQLDLCITLPLHYYK